MESVQAIKQRFEIIGNDPKLNRAIEKAVQVAPTDISVLVTGESGVGKEAIPKIIHSLSHRKHAKYIAVNCGAIPEGTIDSELFGHEKGAFTGATQTRSGYFEVADGGTIFLDEVGELPLTTQVRLLRVLENGEFLKVGSSQVQKTNVRIVAATNVNMFEAIKKEKFREDLYYRLNVVQLHIPPLRDRKDDIALLFEYFTRDAAKRFDRTVSPLTPAELARFNAYDWPGNVRQLVNVVEQCVALTQTPVVPLHLVEQALSATRQSWPTLTEARDAFEQKYLFKLLKMTDGNVTRAAELAGRNRTDMHKLMKKHNLDAGDFR